jgi:hypothetical protein
MKKSLLLVAAIVATLALAGTACAQWDCFEMPPCKPVCVPQVLCQGSAHGVIPLCGPCHPVVCYKGSWLTVCACPPGTTPPAVKKAVKARKRMKK